MASKLEEVKACAGLVLADKPDALVVASRLDAAYRNLYEHRRLVRNKTNELTKIVTELEVEYKSMGCDVIPLYDFSCTVKEKEI